MSKKLTCATCSCRPWTVARPRIKDRVIHRDGSYDRVHVMSRKWYGGRRGCPTGWHSSGNPACENYKKRES